jgi:hypothetical protein
VLLKIKSFIPESSEDAAFSEEHKRFSEPLSTLQIHKNNNTNPKENPISCRVLKVFTSLFEDQRILKQGVANKKKFQK